MSRVRSSLFLTIGIITCFLIQAQGADKYTDENRPYEFGFTIDGEQHRHEKKDKNGIIQGEFGFITADGVYHVTVYATDEQGRFKIISMKNIRVKPYPTGPTRQGHSLSIPPSPSQSTNAITPAKELSPPHDKSPATSAPPQSKPVSNEAPIKSCSHCSIPTTTTPAPPPLPPSYNNPQDVSFSGARDQSVIPSPNYPGQQNSGPNIGGQQGFETPSQQSNNNLYPQQGNSGPPSQQSYPGSPQNYPGQQNNPGQQYSPEENPINPQQQNYPSQPNNVAPYDGKNVGSPAAGGPYNEPSSQAYPPQGNTEAQNYSPQNVPGITAQDNSGSPQYPNQNNQIQPEGARSPKQFNSNEQPSFPGLEEAVRGQSPDENLPPPNQPKLIAAQMQIVDKNTDIHTKRPGETDGLPQGLNKNDMEQLLYTFNYTLGFHGHFEEGYRNGAKQGYYFITGRNGIRTRVDYTADDTGFHPKISQEVFDISSDEVPKPETEKDEKYGLKGYEFKWLYYPVGS